MDRRTRVALLIALSTAACGEPSATEREDARAADAGVPRDASSDASPGEDAPAPERDAGLDALVDASMPRHDAGSLPERLPFDETVPEGFPDSRTTGALVETEALERIDGDYRSRSAGEIIENVWITGTLTIGHADVRVRNCRVNGGPNSAISIRAEGAVIEDCEIGLESEYAILTDEVSPGDTSITVDRRIAAGAYVLLSSERREQQTFRVVSVSGSGPFRLALERHHVRGAGDETLVTSPPEIVVDHPRGATISIYDPSTMPPLPGNGIAGTADSYDVRRCDIHHVNDGFKMRGGVYEDNYVHELIYVPPAHLDSVQSTYGLSPVLRHNSLAISLDANGIQLEPDQGPLEDLQIIYNYISGGGFAIRWGASSGALAHNRLGASRFGPITVYSGGRLDEVRDNRLVTDGSVIGTRSEPGLGDRDGDGTGGADGWGTGYDAAYALPGND